MKRLAIIACILSAASLVAGTIPLPARTTEGGEQFSALLFLQNGAGRRMVGAGMTVDVNIYIESYSSDADVERGAQAFRSGGQQALRSELEKMKGIGRVSAVGRVGQFELKMVRSRPLPNGGRRIIGVSDRPITFLELYAASPSADYTIGLVEIDLKPPNSKGKEEGTGSLVYAAKIKVQDSKTVEVENYGPDPAQLRNVRKF